jgi:uncharacterized DUF497 family protein
VDYAFRWNDWNLDHIDAHGMATAHVESLICRARPPYPEKIGKQKYLVIGQTADGTHVQAIYTFDADETVYVIHARPLTDAEKRRYRRRLR